MNGTSTGTSWSGTPLLPGETGNAFYDGTSDGNQNYTVEYLSVTDAGLSTPNVIATDLNWQNPVALFSIPGAHALDYLGIAYDPTNDSLWLSGYNTDVIADYSLTGTLLSSFSTGTGAQSIFALGLDPADETLWFSLDQTNMLYQYSRSGVLLQNGLAGLPRCCYFSGDFAEAASVCLSPPRFLSLPAA